MKFKFCGNVACPEWFLTKIHLLNRLPEEALEALMPLLGSQDKDRALLGLTRQGYTSTESACLISVLLFIVKNSLKWQVRQDILLKEMLDLGVSRELAVLMGEAIERMDGWQDEKEEQSEKFEPVRIQGFRRVLPTPQVHYVQLTTPTQTMRVPSTLAHHLLMDLQACHDKLKRNDFTST